MNRPDGTVEVVAYDPAWPRLFRVERTLLLDAVPGLFVTVEHVGSTAVPGLVAKPTIDILAVVADPGEVLRHLGPLSVAGYDHRPGSFPDEDSHLFLRKVREGKRLAHLHVLASTSGAVGDYRLFRDFLRACPVVAGRYAGLKLGLAARFAHDRVAYVETKQREVDGLMDEARRWAQSAGATAATGGPPGTEGP